MSGPVSRKIPMVTTDNLGPTPLRYGTAVQACAVSGANVLRDIREAVTNTLGGKMKRYERLLDATIERALHELEDRAIAAGYDAVVGLNLSHPMITEGAIEVVAVGTGVWIDSESV